MQCKTSRFSETRAAMRASACSGTIRELYRSYESQGEVLLAPLRERVKAITFGSAHAKKHTRIELCTMGYRAGVVGAALLAKR